MNKAADTNWTQDYFENRPYAIYPRKGYVCIDGFKYYNLVDIRHTVDLNTRLSWPPRLFAAVNKAKQGRK